MKKVIVFGGAGFLGRYIVKDLVRKKYKVKVFDQKKINFKDKNISCIIGNISNLSQVMKAVKGSSYVFNLAGISDIGESIKNPIGTVNINILGTVNILEASRLAGVKKIIFASSIYVLSNQGGFYRTSKNACELYIQEYKKRFNLNYTILRFGSIFGEGANVKNSISKIINYALRYNKIKYSGTKNALRKFLHVRDASSATIKAISKKYSNKALLITGKRNFKIKNLLRYLKKKMKIKKNIEFGNKTDMGHYDKSPFSYKPIRNETYILKNSKYFFKRVDNLIENLKNEKKQKN